jgi:ectoine hydroxylase-related dioxygenase (phytanoyl-CoA dioxygenase family)
MGVEVDARVQQLDEDGYVVLERRMETAQLGRARKEIRQLLSTTDWGSGFDGSHTRRVWALVARSRCMDDAALDRVVLDIVDRLIGPRAQFSLTQATEIHPGQLQQVLHYEQGIYPLSRDRDVMLTTIWAIDDFTATNGGTLVVPGSHLSDCKPKQSETISIEMPAGSVLIMRGRLWHAGGSNTSVASRLGVIIDYVQPWLRPCEAHTLSSNLDEVRDLPERLQGLLGFNQPTPYLGFVNGEHPMAWLAHGTRVPD